MAAVPIFNYPIRYDFPPIRIYLCAIGAGLVFYLQTRIVCNGVSCVQPGYTMGL